MYPTFYKNDQTISKATLNERGMTFLTKHVGRGIKDFHNGEKSKVAEVVQNVRGSQLTGTNKTHVQLHSSRACEVGAGGSRGREKKRVVENNHPNIADAKKKRKVTTMADNQTCDSGKKYLKNVVVLRKKQQVLPSQSVRRRLRHN